MTTKPSLTLEERRARRQERREKQRGLNIGRAAKMHAARLTWEESAPAAHADAAKGSTRPEIHVGCSGWFYWHWRGILYPEGLATSEWFACYARLFRTVELNSPFYSWPTLGTIATWQRQAGKREFVYTVKVSELITHIKQFTGTRTLIKDFGHIADLLGKRMGCLLFQMPPSFQYTPARLQRIVSQLEPHRRNVVEFRHRSWWNETVHSAFRARGIIFCSCSAPRLPDTLVTTGDEVYVRFHGTKQWYRHNYSREELKEWADRIRASGATKIWAYFNNDREGHALKNARAFKQLCSRASEISAPP